MSIFDKSEENKRVAQKCLNIDAYNAGVTRAYYAVFQRCKHYLIEKGFDYSSFLQSRNKVYEKPYSHGTIQNALTACMMTNSVPYAEIMKLSFIDRLYLKRRCADYYDRMIPSSELEDCIVDMNIIIDIIDGALAQTTPGGGVK